MHVSTAFNLKFGCELKNWANKTNPSTQVPLLPPHCSPQVHEGQEQSMVKYGPYHKCVKPLIQCSAPPTIAGHTTFLS